MKLVYKAYLVTLLLLTLAFAASAQDNPRSDKDRKNLAPTVGTGGPVGGPTGLFTVYDGQTLRKGEYTFSAAYSNYDRDPGNVDITEVPLSFQIGVTNHIEFFFTTNAYRGIHVNSPRNLSSFYLPNTQVLINGAYRSAPAIILAPQGPGTSSFPGAPVFRPTGLQPFVAFPFTGGNSGTFGLQLPFFSGPQFGFAAGTNATIGPPNGGHGGSASNFPGLGSVYGSILPGVVLQTITLVNNQGVASGEGPSVFTTAPSYLPDAPFIDRRWSTSSFNTWNAGFKWRMNNLNSPIGYGLVGFYRWYTDNAGTTNGFNQLQRGASPGGSKGDFGVTAFAEARLAPWVDLSANVGVIHNSSVKADFPNGNFTLLDRPDEFQAAIGVDMHASKSLDYIAEIRGLKYFGGRTPNAFEQNPIDGIAGIRWFPRRWWGIGGAYRVNFNQQSSNSFSKSTTTLQTVVACRPGVANCTPVTISTSFSGVPPGFDASTDPNGYIAQFFIGNREKRATDIPNKPAVIDSVDLNSTTITLPCRPGTHSRSGACSDTGKSVSISTKAHDPENDVITYNYTVSGGRIQGSGASVQWDLSSLNAGTYTVTVGVDDGCGVCSKTETRTVNVRECPDCVTDCECPTLSVGGPSGLTTPGDTMTFTASVSGNASPSYNWVVSAGTIESGQGTPVITVRTPPDLWNGSVTATVTLGNLCSSTCPGTGSATAGLPPQQEKPIVTEFGSAPSTIKNDDLKKLIDDFTIQVNSTPNAEGYIINYGKPAEVKRRKALIQGDLKFLKRDTSHIVFVDGPDRGAGAETVLKIVPPGAAKPVP